MSAAPDEPAAPPCTEQDVQRLQQQLAALRSSWTWRLGRILTKPFDLFVRRDERRGRELSGQAPAARPGPDGG